MENKTDNKVPKPAVELTKRSFLSLVAVCFFLCFGLIASVIDIVAPSKENGDRSFSRENLDGLVGHIVDLDSLKALNGRDSVSSGSWFENPEVESFEEVR